MEVLIRRLERYFDAKKLTVNVGKMKVMRFRKGGGRQKQVDCGWKGKRIEEVKEFKYLGYTFKKNGKQDGHIKERVKKAYEGHEADSFYVLFLFYLIAAYLMADQGYDVWLGNNRGNIYSRNHTSISPKDKCFWDFSFHELGLYDLPAIIDYVIEITGSSRIFYVGHSQGSTQFFVMISTFPEYNSKIILMGGLAPAAYTSNIRGPVTKLAQLTYLGVWVGEKFGYPEFGSRSNWGKFLASFLCHNEALTQILCKNIFFLIAGFNEEDLNLANFPVIIGHIPAGASWKQFVHYGQGFINPGYFRHFDYGNIQINFEIYNASEPLEYNLESVTTPVALFSSNNDWLATPEDVNMLRKKLPNIVLDYEFSMNSFNHYDFIWGCRAPHLVFDTLLNLMAKYL
ncbi:gastric triacylglycerol lipase [Cephus cinctus]|uniref:Gastric triacylglycerol lipase n=1 Tax=Cephus cinctus TaxID=211228 RepID=A0AAJ7FPM5_CEPCN|nr:gastric triacylglycerol lipase [Cephus cinctus]